MKKNKHPRKKHCNDLSCHKTLLKELYCKPRKIQNNLCTMLAKQNVVI